MASATTFDAVSQKLIKTLEDDVHQLCFYARPQPAQLDNIESKIADLEDQFAKLKLELEVLGGSELGQMLLDLIEEQKVKLESETCSYASLREGHMRLCTADWQVSRLVEKFSSIGLAVKELDDNITSNPTQPQPLIQVLDDRQKEARTELQRLVNKLSQPVYSALFDEFNRAILNLWDISHAIEKKLSKLTGKPIVQPPPPANNISPFQRHHHSLADLVDLRLDILKAVSEKELAKTIHLYIDALEVRAHVILMREADSKEKWNEQCQARIQLGNFRKYLERYEERVDQGRDQLLCLGQWFEDVVQKGVEDGHQVHHLKPELGKWSSLATEPARDDNTEEILDLASIGAFRPPGQSISDGLEWQRPSLDLIRRNITKDIAPGHVRDAMLTHISTFEKLAGAVEKRDELFYTRWLTETRNNERRKHELDDYEKELVGRGKIDYLNKTDFNNHVDKHNTRVVKKWSDLCAREAAVSRREAAAQFGCQIL